MKDYFIIGQGLAGSMLAWKLMQKGCSVQLIDRFDASASSQVAAGVYLPVTGRRMVRTWLADELIPYAEKFYSSLEDYFKTTFIRSMPVLEIPDSVRTYNEWQMRKENDEAGKYISGFYSSDKFPELHCPHGAVELSSAGFVNLKLLLSRLRSYFISQHALIESVFDFSLLKVDDSIHYGDFEAKNIIFCEGIAAQSNPYFKHLPFQPSKGEILTFRSEQLTQDYIINKSVFVLPIGNHLFKAGSTYEWKELNYCPTEAAREKLTRQLEALLRVPFELTNHQASIRPSVKARRPFAGMRTDIKNVGIFNGLGTKGVMLAPYLAEHLCNHLLHHEKLMPEINIAQYDELL
ncbi:MAG: FAD-binding oxidoreductase [Bacteroidetes bacterium]|jgi:glycine/D-amino acid oxidase-like deaminating enzyme|nr:FAD-binding oxidoreductase [Bacteroidota bacterium]